jgi:hypothetical protein
MMGRAANTAANRAIESEASTPVTVYTIPIHHMGGGGRSNQTSPPMVGVSQ